ncbi:hypothetical protein [Streptosporangium subroseum]|uniref:hypothetical protein n=1 Tax=Streptosporangium subroseum TaxID=106412 RepID=UPI00308B50A2|nr:hypothetical protein OHB15_41555 [Streptosporangium subroseum]
MRDLRKKNTELKRANEISGAASALFATELQAAGGPNAGARRPADRHRRLSPIVRRSRSSRNLRLHDDRPTCNNRVALNAWHSKEFPRELGSRVGREVRYSLRPVGLDATTRWMSSLAADWDRRLPAIKRAAEAAERDFK